MPEKYYEAATMGEKPMKEKSAAVLTIKRGNAMTNKSRREIAAWLRRQASFLVSHGSEFSSRFTAKYLYRCTIRSRPSSSTTAR